MRELCESLVGVIKVLRFEKRRRYSDFRPPYSKGDDNRHSHWQTTHYKTIETFQHF